MDKLAIASAIYRAATPENLRELQECGNAGPIADAVIGAIHATGMSNKPLNADALAQGIEARSDTTRSGVAEGESPAANGDAPTPHPHPEGSSH